MERLTRKRALGTRDAYEYVSSARKQELIDRLAWYEEKCKGVQILSDEEFQQDLEELKQHIESVDFSTPIEYLDYYLIGYVSCAGKKAYTCDQLRRIFALRKLKERQPGQA